MLRKLSGLKDIFWAGFIAIALFALLIGFFIGAIGRYYGDKTRPIMDLSGQAGTLTQKSEGADKTGTTSDGTLHSLEATADAGQGYLDDLTYLCDSSLIALRGSGLVAGQVWGSETGLLPLGDVSSWSIRYPGDDSYISPANAALVAKPKVLVMAIGSDGLNDLNRETFIANYEWQIKSILAASPDTRIICCSLCSVTAAYIGTDGMSGEKSVEVDAWIRQVCEDTGAYYADLTPSLTDGGYLRSEFADSSGRGLNTAGLNTVLNYLRSHSIFAQ